ncbi:MAG: hypothetical protein EOO27_39560 [Comamonadaceae bacterium]|nr:MAG: hypothetical protein EOO27_39560 [Comamonadaceae bacterium]
MTLTMEKLKTLKRLQQEVREAMDRASAGRMELTGTCAAAVQAWAALPTADQVRDADQRGAFAESKWRELDDYLETLWPTDGLS